MTMDLVVMELKAGGPWMNNITEEVGKRVEAVR